MPVPIAMGIGLLVGAVSERYQIPYIPNYRDVTSVTTGTDLDMEARAFAQAKQYLIAEEGRRDVVYNDSRGIPTAGIGHKVTAADGLRVGDHVTTSQIESWFSDDASAAFNAAVDQSKEIDKYNLYMIARLTSVNFQLGKFWRTKFPNTWSMIKEGNVDGAIQNLLQSSWYQQTPNRVLAFAETLRQQFA